MDRTAVGSGDKRSVVVSKAGPGVYLLREPAAEVIRDAGMAGERSGSGRPLRLYGRLSV